MSHNITIFRCLAKFTRKHLSLSLFFNKVAGLRPAKRLWRRCFPVNFSKYLRSQKWVTNHCYWIWFFYHGWNIVNIVSNLVQFSLYDVTRIVKFPHFGKIMEEKFFTTKNIHCSKFEIFYCLIAIYCFETALKNLGKWGYGGDPVSHLPPIISQKL